MTNMTRKNRPGRRAATSPIGAAVPKIGAAVPKTGAAVPNWGRSRPYFVLKISFLKLLFLSIIVFLMHIRLVIISQESDEFFPALNFLRGEAHERFKRLRVFHAQPFSSFSRIYFSESLLGTKLFY
jgi:hypothetical protein